MIVQPIELRAWTAFPGSAQEGIGRMAASVSRAICVQKPGSKCTRDREATSFARRSVAAPRPPHAKAAGVIRSDSGAGRGQHCSPLRAVVDAAPIQTTKKVSLAALRN
jgi:pyruvate, orthophosphate dikinase